MSSGRLDKRLLDKFRETCTYMHVYRVLVYMHVYRELDGYTCMYTEYVHAENCMCSLHVNHTQLHGNEDSGHYTSCVPMAVTLGGHTFKCP